jgi:hypothetical protein
MDHGEPQADHLRRRGVIPGALAALVLLLAGCSDATPLYGPNSPRDGMGRPVDPIYGTPLPGTWGGSGGM